MWDKALTMPGAKRLLVVALRDLSARDLSNALLDRIRQNAAPGEVEGNVIGIAAVGGAFGARKRMNKGEVLTVDYLPLSKTTEFRLNGQPMIDPIPGDKLYPLLMKVWIRSEDSRHHARCAHGCPALRSMRPEQSLQDAYSRRAR